MEKFKSIQVWIRGLIAAAIGGAANAVTTVVVAPETFNLHDGLSKLGAVAGASALVSAAMYLKQSPVPMQDLTEATSKPTPIEQSTIDKTKEGLPK